MLKAFIPIGFFLLALQGMANVYRKIRAMQGEAPPELPDSFVKRAEKATAVAEEALKLKQAGPKQ